MGEGKIGGYFCSKCLKRLKKDIGAVKPAVKA